MAACAVAVCLLAGLRSRLGAEVARGTGELGSHGGGTPTIADETTARPRVPLDPAPGPTAVREGPSAPTRSEPALELPEPVPASGVLTGLLSPSAPEQARFLDGLEVHLAADEAVRASCTTDFLGRFRLPALPEGTYRLVVGDAEAPLLVVEQVALVAPLTVLEERILPALVPLTVLVVDESELPVAGAEVRGTCERGGGLHGTTDPAGILEAVHLAGGTTRVFASHPGLGRGNQVIVLEADGRRDVRIVRVVLRRGPVPRELAPALERPRAP